MHDTLRLSSPPRRCRLIRTMAVTAMLGSAMAVLPGCTPTASVYAANAVSARSGAGGVIHFVPRLDLPLAVTRINGQDVGFFLLDTGSSTTVIHAPVAAKLGLKESSRMLVRGIGGTLTAPVADANTVEAGGVSFGGRSVAIIDLAAFNKSIGWPVAGIIGLDSLGGQPFTLDFAAHTLTLHEAASFRPPAGAEAFDLANIDGLPAVRGAVAGREAWLQLDTGANGDVAMDLSYVQHHPGLVAGQWGSMSESVGVAGAAGMARAKLESLTVFGRTLTEVGLQVELADPTAPVATGRGPLIARLGNGVLSRAKLTIDWRRGRLWAQWRD